MKFVGSWEAILDCGYSSSVCITITRNLKTSELFL